MQVIRRSSLLLALAGLLTWGGVANATPMQVTFNGTITSYSPTGGPGTLDDFISVGASFALDMFVDSATPNEGAAPDFQATSPGTVAAFLIIDITGTVDAVTATNGTTWDANGVLDLAGNPAPYSMSLSGTGLTPGQILPDFGSLTGGTVAIDLSGLLADAFVNADITSITIAEVPEPTTALLVAFGLGGLTAAGRRRIA